MRLMPSPRISANQVISGQLDAGRIPELDASKVTTGTLNLARIPALDAGRIPGLDASKIVSGLINGARVMIPVRGVGYETTAIYDGSISDVLAVGVVVSGAKLFEIRLVGGRAGTGTGVIYAGVMDVSINPFGNAFSGSWEVLESIVTGGRTVVRARRVA